MHAAGRLYFFLSSAILGNEREKAFCGAAYALIPHGFLPLSIGRFPHAAGKGVKMFQDHTTERQTVAKKRLSGHRDLIVGVFTAVLGAAAVVAACLNAGGGAAGIILSLAAAAIAALCSAYCFCRFAAVKKLPQVLVYAEGGTLFCYEYKKKAYRGIALQDVLFAEAGNAADVRAGILRIRTASGVFEIPEVDGVSAAQQAILLLKEKAGRGEGKEAPAAER